jgi:hypothetical protein
MSRHPSPLPHPSRTVLNAGILAGAIVGFLVQNALESNDVQAFLITGGCCLLGAFVFTIAELTWRRRR